MPSNWLFVDTNFPTFTGEESTDEKISTMQNYMFMLVEQLRYSMQHLDSSNITEIDMDTTKIYSGGTLLQSIIKDNEKFSIIEQNLNEIHAAVYGEEGGSDVVIGEGGIIAQVKGLQGDMKHTLQLTADGASLVDGDGKTVTIKSGWINAEGLTVSAANITGTLTIGKQLPSDLATTGDIPQYISDLWDDSDFVDESGVVEIVEGTIDADYIYALGIEASSLKGETITLNDGWTNSGWIYLDSGDVNIEAKDSLALMSENGDYGLQIGNGVIDVAADMVPWYDESFDLGSSKYYWNNIYAATCECCTSDRNKKNSIEDLPDKYVAMFDNLVPKRFKMNKGTSDRYHVGFISQEVEEAMTSAGITSQEFGGFIKDTSGDGNKVYMLRYSEFIGILVAKVQRMQGEIDDLKARMS